MQLPKPCKAMHPLVIPVVILPFAAVPAINALIVVTAWDVVKMVKPKYVFKKPLEFPGVF